MQTTRRNVSLQPQPERSKQPSCKAFYGDKSSIRKRIILHLQADIFTVFFLSIGGDVIIAVPGSESDKHL